MCLTIDGSLHKESILTGRYKPYVAQQNIIVYKALNKTKTKTSVFWHTPYMNTTIIFDGDEYPAWSCEIEDKFKYDGRFSCKLPHTITKGIHSFCRYRGALRGIVCDAIFFAVIPKGTKFYLGIEENGYRDVVSERLIIFDQIVHVEMSSWPKFCAISMTKYMEKYINKKDNNKCVLL